MLAIQSAARGPQNPMASQQITEVSLETDSGSFRWFINEGKRKVIVTEAVRVGQSDDRLHLLFGEPTEQGQHWIFRDVLPGYSVPLVDKEQTYLVPRADHIFDQKTHYGQFVISAQLTSEIGLQRMCFNVPAGEMVGRSVIASAVYHQPESPILAIEETDDEVLALAIKILQTESVSSPRYKAIWRTLHYHPVILERLRRHLSKSKSKSRSRVGANQGHATLLREIELACQQAQVLHFRSLS